MMSSSACSGRRRRRRIAGEVAGGRKLGMSSGKTLEGSRGRMGWCRRRRRRWRFLWTHRRGTGWTVAAVICVGDDELRSGVLGRGSRGRGREQRVRERSEGVEGRCVAFTAASGKRRKQEVARARAGVRRTHASRPSGARWGTTGRWACWAATVPCQPGKCQVFSLSLVLMFFYFSVTSGLY